MSEQNLSNNSSAAFQIAVKAIIQKGDKILILKQAESDPNDPLSGWETPGGKLEGKEDLEEGLKREIKEETGLEVTTLFPFHAYSVFVNRENWLAINYVCEYKGGEVVLNPAEHTAYQWITLDSTDTLQESMGLKKEIAAYKKSLNKLKSIQ